MGGQSSRSWESSHNEDEVSDIGSEEYDESQVTHLELKIGIKPMDFGFESTGIKPVKRMKELEADSGQIAIGGHEEDEGSRS
ncbi:hypothetical protein LXL04_000938 [Taraxacum kok-saghyz]